MHQPLQRLPSTPQPRSRQPRCHRLPFTPPPSHIKQQHRQAWEAYRANTDSGRVAWHVGVPLSTAKNAAPNAGGVARAPKEGGQPPRQYGLRSLLQDRDTSTRGCAANALGRMRAVAASAEPGPQVADQAMCTRMQQASALLHAKLQQAELVRAEVQEDARQKAEQLRALNSERLQMIEQLQDHSSTAAALRATATQRGEAVQQVAVQTNLIRMKLHDESHNRALLADRVRCSDERTESMLQLNTHLLGMLQQGSTSRSQIEAELRHKHSYLTELDGQTKALVGVVRAEESARQRNATCKNEKNSEIERLSRHGAEASVLLAAKERMLRTQGEQLRLLRDRSSALISKDTHARQQLWEQGTQLQILNRHHQRLGSRLRADGELFN